MIIVLVCGGRDYMDRDRVFNVLDDLHSSKGIAHLRHGGAAGADAQGKLLVCCAPCALYSVLG